MLRVRHPNRTGPIVLAEAVEPRDREAPTLPMRKCRIVAAVLFAASFLAILSSMDVFILYSNTTVTTTISTITGMAGATGAWSFSLILIGVFLLPFVVYGAWKE